MQSISPVVGAAPAVPRRFDSRSRSSFAFVLALFALTTMVPSAAVAVSDETGSTSSLSSTYGPYCNSGAPILSVRTRARAVAFTFDDGPWPEHTTAVMNHFRRHRAKATFFMIGQNVERYPDIAREVVRRGHEVANHAYSHRYSPSVIAAEIPKTQRVIKRITGVRPRTFRPPGLTRASVIDAMVAERGLCNIHTDYDLGDWRSPRASATTLCGRFKQALHPGFIALLHDGGTHANTVDAVPCMINYAKAQGYSILVMTELLELRRN